MAKKKFKNGEKVKIDCSTSQLKLIQVENLSPEQEVFIVRKSFTDKDQDFYIVNEKPLKLDGQTIPENYLQTTENQNN